MIDEIQAAEFTVGYFSITFAMKENQLNTSQEMGRQAAGRENFSEKTEHRASVGVLKTHCFIENFDVPPLPP